MPKPTLSVVMPCLNERGSIKRCIRQAKQGLEKLGAIYASEIIVADNGSTDGSDEIAKEEGATVVYVHKKGYGHAYIRGLSKAKGEYIIIGDSDGTYDFRKIPRIVKQLEDGADLVLGSRFLGNIQDNAMPWLNRYIGNPVLTGMLNIFYNASISDAHTGFRGIRKSALRKMKLRSGGMEFASEMIIKALSHSMSITEIPISYSPRTGVSKLSPLSDAWRHVYFMALFSPTYILIIPGLSLLFIGSVISVWLLPGGKTIGSMYFDIHSMTIGLLSINIGIQLMLLGLFSRLYAYRSLGLPGGKLSKYLISHLSPYKLFFGGLSITAIGLLPLFGITISWLLGGFSDLAYAREVTFFVGISIAGAQIMSASLLYGLLDHS